MKKLLPAVLLSALVATMPSCVLAAGVALGAGAMYSLGEDSVQTYVEVPMTDAFAAAQAEFRDSGELGLLEAANKESFIRATVEDNEVEVFFHRITDNTTEMVVKARKWADMAPNLELAERVSDRITYRLER